MTHYSNSIDFTEDTELAMNHKQKRAKIRMTSTRENIETLDTEPSRKNCEFYRGNQADFQAAYIGENYTEAGKLAFVTHYLKMVRDHKSSDLAIENIALIMTYPTATQNNGLQLMHEAIRELTPDTADRVINGMLKANIRTNRIKAKL